VSWVLSRSGLFLNSVGDITILPRVLDAAARFCSGDLKVSSPEEMKQWAADRQVAPLFVV
jgi:hypothetical protein